MPNPFGATFLPPSCPLVCPTFVMTQWVTHLLTVYLLGLSLWPCSDNALPPAGSGNQSVVARVADANAGLPADQHQHDQCSPFCSCACCATTVTPPPPFLRLPGLVFLPVTVLTAAYPVDLSAGPLFAIWQPPKFWV